jgi:hypothetical protein
LAGDESRYDAVPVELSAAAILPPELQRGELFRVRERVENDGFLNGYVIDSDFGTLEATSTSDLRTVVAEIGALAELEELTRREALVDAAGNAITAPVKTAIAVAERPVETLKRAPGGVARYFKRTYRRAKDLAAEAQEEYGELKEDLAERKERKAAEAAREAEREAATGDADALPAADVPAAGAERKPEEEPEWKELADDAGDEAARYARSRFGYSRERRRIAHELGVDPYTDNEPLNEELDRVAKAAAVGGLSVRFAGLGMPFFISDLGQVSDIVWKLHPLDLRLRNEKLLREEVGLADEEIAALYENRRLGQTLITSLVEALVELDGVVDRRVFTEFATDVDSRDLAAFLVRIAGYHARNHRAGNRIERFEAASLVPVAALVDGSRVVALAVDYLAWTPELEELFAERGGEGEPVYWPSPVRRCVLEGGASPATRRALEAKGWQLVESGF